MTLEPVHFSALKRMAQSPAHYRYGLDVGFRSSRYMDLGTLIHALILGGDAIVYDGERAGREWHAFKALVDGRDFLVYDGPRRGKAWQTVKADAGASIIVSTADAERADAARLLQAARRAAGKHDVPIATSAEYDRARLCAESVINNPLVREHGLLQGEREAPLKWRWLGRDCAGRLDVLDTFARQTTEVKTTARAEPEWFVRQALRMHYHGQCSWYRDGARTNGWVIERCFIVAVEPYPPFASTVMLCTERVLEEGAKIVRLWFERLLSCEAVNEWPAYSQSVLDFDAPEPFELEFGDDEEDEAA